MSVLDWVEVGYAAKGEEPSWFPGSLGVTIGDAYSGVFGTQAYQTLGTYLNLVVDPEDMLLARFPILEPVMSLVSGIGGNASFIYGQNNNFTYLGPQGTVTRAPSWSKTANSLFGSYTFQGPGQPAPGAPDPADTAIDALVTVLSVLMWATFAGLELAIKIKYWKMGSAVQDTDPDKQEKDEQAVRALLITLKVLLPRLMAVIKLMEQGCTIAKFGTEYGKGLAWPFKVVGGLLGMVGTVAATVTLWFPLVSGPAIVIGAALDKDYMEGVLMPVTKSVGSCFTYTVDQLKELGH